MYTINLKLDKSTPTLSLEEFTKIFDELDISRMFKLYSSNSKYSIDSVDELYTQYVQNKERTDRSYYNNFSPDINMYYTFESGRIILTAKLKGFTVSTTSNPKSKWGSDLKGTTQKFESTLIKFNRTIDSFQETRKNELTFSNKESVLESLVKNKFSNKDNFYTYNKYNNYNPTWNIQLKQNSNWLIQFNATLNQNNELSFSKFEFNIPTTCNIQDVSNTISEYMNILNSVM